MDNTNIIEELSKLSLIDFLKKYNSLSSLEKEKLINSPDLDKLNPSNFNSLFLQLTEEETKKVLKKEKVFDKVMNSPKNRNGRSILNILGERKKSVLKDILESEYISKHYETIESYIRSLKKDQYKELSKSINIDKLIPGIPYLKDKRLIAKRFKEEQIDEDIINIFYTKVKTNQLNPLGLLKVNNYKEFIIYTKFNLLVDIEKDMEEITLSNGLVLPYEELINSNESKINKIIKLLQEKSNISDECLLDISTKLFYIFGYDNARKLLMDKFTNLTESSIVRITDYNFKDARREFRTKNQNKFYHHEMIDEVIESLKTGDNKIFEVLLYYPTSNEVEDLKNMFKESLNSSNDENKTRELLKFQLKELIQARENKYKASYKESTEIRLKAIKKEKNTLSVEELKNLLDGIDIYNFIKKYSKEKSENIQKFLLGNAKAENDCLLRLIINKEALGLNKMLSELINKYDIISSVAKKNNMSLNSVLDIIDIVKLNFFALKPNEQDIFLSTLSKIISSKQYCTGNESEIIKEVYKLHVKRKEKVYSSIPTVEGNYNGLEYKVAPFDAEYLLAAGVDAKNCFRISAKGEDFFEYCLTSPHAVIVGIKDKKDNVYVCPIIRSGNAINCNGIDPIIPQEEKDNVVGALKQCLEDIINESDDKDKIEVATVTDLHLEDYFNEKLYKKYNLQEYLPLDYGCYTDYNKEETTHYILACTKDYQKNKYYLSEDRYYQKRDYNYEFDINNEYDKERLSLIVNSICYSAIEYKNISLKEKQSERRRFKSLNVNAFKYIIGNKDWYIAIDENYNIIGNILPYDDRAKRDYFKALTTTPLVLESIMEGVRQNGAIGQDLPKNKR